MTRGSLPMTIDINHRLSPSLFDSFFYKLNPVSIISNTSKLNCLIIYESNHQNDLQCQSETDILNQTPLTSQQDTDSCFSSGVFFYFVLSENRSLNTFANVL